jgi:enamine deaminase RidA (YjgF/YER057c/UK114 family)
MANVEKKLEKLGLTLPNPVNPAANYLPYVVTDTLILISGQIPIRDGNVIYKGKVGVDCTLEDAIDAARLCGLNILAQLKDALLGDWTRLVKCARIGGFVNSTPDFTQHPQVINGASDLMIAALGEEIGPHARASVGVNSLPKGAAVEVEALFIIRE